MSETEALLQLLWMLVADPLTGVLIGLLLAAAVIDWRTMRIPNWLTVGGMVYGLAASAAQSTSVGAGLATAAGGLGLGLVLLLPLWLLRIMGAGDVKLMAMVGAFTGPAGVLSCVVYVLILGGLAAIVLAIMRGSLGLMLKNLQFILTVALMPAGGSRIPSAAAMPSIGKLPYGLCICIGTVAFLVARQLGYA